MINIFGFTILRNGIKYDYPFKESLKSLAGPAKEVFLALGKSDDGTEKEVSDLDFLKIIPTIWDDNLREGGLILSQQTNLALEGLRSIHKDKNAWGIYLQCDEVFHENDYQKIREDIQHAEENGYDAVSFRYFHFWGNHHEIAINKKWYPNEIRAIKLDTPIESWGDAQSFRKVKKVFYSNARIFHYGHVREADSYQKKKKDILKFYHSDKKMKKYQKREKRFDNQTQTLFYFGSHPKVMHERMNRLGDLKKTSEKENIYIVGNEKLKLSLPVNYLKNINSKSIHWVDSLAKVPNPNKSEAIIIEPNLIQKYRFPTKVPSSMKSKLARPWTFETFLTLKLSEKGVSVSSSH